MKRKEAVYKGLQFNDVWQTDTSLTSPDYFQITEFPTQLTAGKNLFKLRGHPTNLKVGGLLNIEVLDYNGDPIYHEVINYIDEDKSRVVAIYIYSETSPGDCTVTLIAEAANSPTEWQGKPNIKWIRSVPVNPNISNVSEIIFDSLPEITLTEEIGPHLDRTYPTGIQFPTYTTGTVRYFSLNSQPAIEIIGGTFTNDMATGTITVANPVNPLPTPNYAVSNAGYASAVKKILSPTTALLDQEYMVLTPTVNNHTYTAFAASTFSLSYEASPVYTQTQNSESYGVLQINNLEPATGDISRIKVFANNNGTIGTWELLNDVELGETEIFVASTSSIYPDLNVGSFTSQSIINTYWDAHTYQGFTETTPPTLTWSTASMSNAMVISSTTNIAARNAVHVAQIKSIYSGAFISSSAYKITLDAIGTRSSTSNNLDPVLSLYLSGSAVDGLPNDYFNNELPVKLGKRIGELRVTSNNQRFDDITFSFETENVGNAVLLLVVEAGDWQVSDIRTTSDNDAGYTPNYTRLKTLVPTAHKAGNQLSFKIEYYNVAGYKSKQVNYVYNLDWTGGNRYVDGEYSMLTGSLYVADSLDSGIAISGYKKTGFIRSLGYEGFEAGFPGFLIWSGSALSGSLGTKGGAPYSGVGIELYANTASYFRYSTTDSEVDIRTRRFFFGQYPAPFISGANGNIEISSSAFHLNPNGSVTASQFTAISNTGVTLFDSNNEFADGLNIGRVVYFDQNEYTFDLANLTGASPSPTFTTGSVVSGPSFHVFILPGETRMQASCTWQIDRTDNIGLAIKTINLYATVMNAVTGSNTGLLSYGIFNSGSRFTSPITLTNPGVPQNSQRSGAATGLYGSVSDLTLADRQGFYVLVHTSVGYSGTTAALTGTLKLKNFVFRTSRTVGGAIDNSANSGNPIL